MRCNYPRTVGFMPDGKTISWSSKSYSKEFPTFKLPCGKCIECRLENARQKAIRAVHESKMHLSNCFITLTYSDEHLPGARLHYPDMRKFIKDLRDKIFRDVTTEFFGKGYWGSLLPDERKLHLYDNKEFYEGSRISVMGVGEYGDIGKRPHWHAIIFNWQPSDMVYARTNENGDEIFHSRILDELWGKNDPEKRPCEVGSVTFKSAGYVARYAAKKLVHGRDQDHDFHPKPFQSSKNAIGKRWLEKYWQDAFRCGRIVLEDGSECSIPRYYEKWLAKNRPEDYLRYVTEVKTKRCLEFEAKALSEERKEREINDARFYSGRDFGVHGSQGITRQEVREKIMQEKFKRLQFIKGDL